MWGMDLTMLPKSDEGNNYFVVAVNYLSKYVEAAPLKIKEAPAILTFFDNICSRFGFPKVVITDQGREFCNQLFEDCCNVNGISHRTSTAYHPQPAADLAVSKTQSPTRPDWLYNNNGESLQVNRCSTWKLAPDKPVVGSDQVSDEACEASGTHPVKVDSSASVEVHPLLPQVCPQAWPPPPKSYVTGRLLPVNTIYLLKSVAVLLMVSGGVIVSLGFLGCCGFMLRSKVMVGTFGCLMTVIVVGQLSTTIVAFLNKDTMQCRLKRELLTALKRNYEGNLNSCNPISQAVDFLELALGCCGVDGPRDLFSTPWYKRTKYTNVTLPWTCCQVDNPGDWPVTTVNEHCPFAKAGPENPNTITPSFELAAQKLKKHYFEVVLFMTTVTAMEVGAMGSAFIVANMLGKWAVRNKLRA
ncbi:hypothetical protein ACOMHN_065108 [Nucella lapillus]